MTGKRSPPSSSSSKAKSNRSSSVATGPCRRGLAVCQPDLMSPPCHRQFPHRRILVALDNAIHMYTFTMQPALLHTFPTSDNPRGLMALCADADNAMLAFPGPEAGQVQLTDLGNIHAPTVFPAHETALACLAFNRGGTLLATASEKGTLVRVFQLPGGKKLWELRRGGTGARVHWYGLVRRRERGSLPPSFFSGVWSRSINFSPDSTKLCVSRSGPPTFRGGAFAGRARSFGLGGFSTIISRQWHAHGAHFQTRGYRRSRVESRVRPP